LPFCHVLGVSDSIESILASVGPSLRVVRQRRRVSLADLAAETGISASTLSRLESGGRRPTLELLLVLARAHGVRLDELVPSAAPQPQLGVDRPFRRDGATFVPLSSEARGMRAFKTILPGGTRIDRLSARVHDGFVWLYVLRGRLRLILGEQELELKPGEVAEFTTRVPHLMSAAGDAAVELLTIYAEHGESPRVRARTSHRTT